jgi:hypothetical protein
LNDAEKQRGVFEMNELIEMLKELEQRRFYGSVEIKFESGAVTLIKKTETINPRARDASHKDTSHKTYREDRGHHEPSNYRR